MKYLIEVTLPYCVLKGVWSKDRLAINPESVARFFCLPEVEFNYKITWLNDDRVF